MIELAGKCWVKKKVKFQTLICQIYTIELGLVKVLSKFLSKTKRGEIRFPFLFSLFFWYMSAAQTTYQAELKNLTRVFFFNA